MGERMHRIVSIIGVRPQFVKHAPLSRALRRRFHEVVIHTGQHYDHNMSRRFFDELSIPAPDHHLEVGSGSHAEQLGWTAMRVEEAVGKLAPDYVLVFGDTNTTLGAALAVAKLGIPLGHVEAGVRTQVPGNPEELNRILVDHASDQLYVPTQAGVAHLEAERVRGTVHLVGDVMYDALLHFLDIVGDRPHPGATLGLSPHEYVLATIHRAENTDDRERLAEIVAGLGSIGEPVVFPVHPRTRAALAAAGLESALASASNVHVIEPAGYLDMLLWVRDARAVVTDSGGLQKEAYLLGTPCVTVFANSPWPETVADGWNRLVAAERQALVQAVRTARPSGTRQDHYGDGHAADAICDVIAATLDHPASRSAP